MKLILIAFFALFSLSQSSTQGNFDIDPEFADSNYYLNPTSNCIDSSNPGRIFNDVEYLCNPDFAKWPIQGVIKNNMGTYGGPLSKLLPDFNYTLDNLLNNPESVVFDSLNNRYLVSNWADGNIVVINSWGQQEYFNTELEQTAGLHIVENILYVASSIGVNTGIIGFDLLTGTIVFDVDITEKQLLNDITSDNSGNLYVSDCEADKIFKVNISNMTYSIFVESGLGYPNGIYFDKYNNRLLVLNGELPYNPIIAVNLTDSSVSTIVNTNISAIDGLTADQFGNYYFSSWTTDKVYRYDASFTNPPEVISSGHNNPADIFYNQLNNVLVVPNFHSNTVDMIPVTPMEVRENEYLPSGFRLQQNYPNPFNPITRIKYEIPQLTNSSLMVYDVLGNEIATLVNEEKPAGIYEVEFDATGLPSGIYFYQLKVENYIQTKKMMVIK